MDVLQSLFAAYWDHARVFAAAHAILALLVFGSLYSFARWRFDDEPPPTIWQQFEIRTDYIHGLIGLFLIVGIAGTFLGLWDVASALERSAPAAAPVSGVPNIDAAKQASETIALLFKGISRAFPVGFVGLVLTLFGNLFANGIESSKRKKIEKFIDDVGDPLTQKLIEVLDPVANLGATIQSGLQPVIASLARALEPIPDAMARQQDELRNAKTALVEAAEALKVSGREISASVTGLKEMSETARAALNSAQALSSSIQRYFTLVMTKLDEATGQASEAFQGYHGAMQTMATSVTEAATAFRQLPAALRTDVTAALVDSYDKASDAREKELADLYSVARKMFQENMANAMSGVMRELADIRDEYEKTSKDMNTSIANAQNALGTYREAWSDDAKVLREDIVRQIDPGMRREMTENAKEALAALEAAAQSGDAFVKSAKKTTGDIDRIYKDAAERLSTAAKDLGRNLTNAANQIQSTASRLDTSTQQRAAKPPGKASRFGKAVVDVLRMPIRIFPRRRRP